MTAVLVPAAVLLLAAGGYAVLRADEVVAAGIGCFDRADLDADVTVVSTTAEDPVAVCTQLWESGDAGARGEVPQMTACVNEPGAVLVLPSGDPRICAELGLQPLPDDYEAAAKRFVEMRDDMIDTLYREATSGGVSERDACLDNQSALRVATSVLEEHGFSDWTAEVATGDYGGRHCANDVAFEDDDKKVLIIPTPPGIDPDPYGHH